MLFNDNKRRKLQKILEGFKISLKVTLKKEQFPPPPYYFIMKIILTILILFSSLKFCSFSFCHSNHYSRHILSFSHKLKTKTIVFYVPGIQSSSPVYTGYTENRLVGLSGCSDTEEINSRSTQPQHHGENSNPAPGLRNNTGSKILILCLV